MFILKIIAVNGITKIALYVSRLQYIFKNVLFWTACKRNQAWAGQTQILLKNNYWRPWRSYKMFSGAIVKQTNKHSMIGHDYDGLC